MAWLNSVRAFRHLIAHEPAFRQEVAVLVPALPVAWAITQSMVGFLLLIGALLFLITVEALNTSVEKACDALTREFNPDIQLAKDCGSLAVLVAMLIAGGGWIFAAFRFFQGAPI
ncbi:MAG: diacylglycerol kinase [Phyllobacteriaceae bacterium]|nr:diacylglycerol kinase [Phyllobacteriaceae bacterium]